MTSIQIYRYESGKYKFDLQAFKKIINKSKDNLVALYSMTGPLRMGKSFMLGFFLRYLQTKGKGDWISHRLDKTFTFRGGSVRETTGIWIWSQPFDVQQKDGTKVSVYLMDTQGCFDDKTAMQDNACVFALSTLLSSLMIFNVQKQLSEDKLQFLQYFAGFAKLADNDNEEESYQKLMFLIRDWEFPDYEYGFYDDNTTIDGKNFKTDKLSTSADQPMDVKFIRESILMTFADISVYLMPHPGKEVAKNSNFDLNSTDEEFVQHLKTFVPLVLKDEAIVPKRIGGQYVTGAQLLKFVEKWSQIFKCDSVPQSLTIGQATAQLQHEMAKVATIEHYGRQMRKHIISKPGVTDVALQLFNKKLVKECIELFKSFKRLGRKEYEDKYIDIINNEMEKTFGQYFAWNSKDREFIELKKQIESQSNRLLKQIEETTKKMNELKAENIAQKEKFEKKLKLNENKLNECKEQFNKELKNKESVIKNIKNDLICMKNNAKRFMETNSGCSVM